jgi:pimeloyl-ACP methyl ester carboxylesterase
MATSFAISPDGTRIAYDVTGTGASIMLLHGGGHTRRHWHDGGYVERLEKDFRVITLDIRGNGESDKPVHASYYTTDKHTQDLLAVADTCNVERFTIWGFSYGANIGRYLAAQSSRVAKIIIVGIPFGLGASGNFRQSIINFRDRWGTILQAKSEGTLDLATLSKKEQDELQSGNVLISLAWLSAMLDWRAIDPNDLLCPALWLIGSKNEGAIASTREYEKALQTSQVRVQIVGELDHKQEFTEIDQVFPAMLAFTQSVA